MEGRAVTAAEVVLGVAEICFSVRASGPSALRALGEEEEEAEVVAVTGTR